MKTQLKKIAAATALAVAAALPAAPARAAEENPLGGLYLFIWTLASPEGASILALDADVWQFLIDTMVPFMTPYGPGLRKMALTKAPTLKPVAQAPSAAPRTISTGYSQVISFGDSMSDTGNMYKVTSDIAGWGLPLAPNYAGRFSNGPVVLEIMSNTLQLPLLNYAFGGGQSSYEGLVPVFALQIGLLKQVDDYMGNLGLLKSADAKALYVIWTGPDDYYEGSNIWLSSTTTGVTNNVKTAMTKLYKRGARNFFVPLMPDLSITPSATSHEKIQGGYIDIARKRSGELATSMTAMLKAFAKQYPLARIRTFDTYTYSQQQYAQAKADGYNVAEACYKPPFMGLPGPVCATPDSYLFWDENHPTAAGSKVIGDAFATAAAGAALPSK
ncbi:MAG: hypothetical protein EPO12_15415 [Aquabacterium sp.]|nr:MAG: hypothetical protein EPO12_15415 [Aquabacterium sp.]